MKSRTLAIGGLATLMVIHGAPGVLQAQQRSDRARDQMERARRAATGMAWAFMSDDRDRPRIGITTESSGMRDTLGLLVSDVTPDGPAAKAGIEEGDRIQSVNGVNLRLSREDAGEDDMEGIATRRLIRVLGKAKIGDEVELLVFSNGATKTVKLKTVAVDDLVGTQFRTSDADDRAALGIGLGSSGSRRDTLGVLIASVVDDGPADKAGLIEGDRVQSINGVDLRVPAVDAGDWAMSSSRVRRLSRELEKAKPGDDVELRVYSGGTTKSVRLKAARASEVRHQSGFYYGGMPGAMSFPRTPMRIGPNTIRYRLNPQDGAQLRRELEQVLPKVAPAVLWRTRPIITI